MSRETRDREYKPKRKIVQQRRTPGRSRQQVQSIKYADSDSDSEATSAVGYHSDITDDKPVHTWTPGTFQRRGEVAEQVVTGLFQQSREYHMAKQTEGSMENMMQMFLQMRQEDKIREDKREEQRLERELEKEEKRLREEREREERREERQTRLIQQLRESQPVVPQTIHVNQHKLPKMMDTDDVDIFLRQFEVSLRTANIPENKWKENLLSQLTLRAKEQVIQLLEREDTDYNEIKEALLSRHITTYAAAAEAFFSANKGEIYTLDLQLAGDKLTRWANKMIDGAETRQDICERMAMGALRAYMIPELKTYLDLTKPTTKPEFEALAEQWVKSQLYKRSMYKQQGGYKQTDSFRYRQDSSSPYNSANRKPMTCYTCGKVGHMSKDCRSKPLDTSCKKKTFKNVK